MWLPRESRNSPSWQPMSSTRAPAGIHGLAMRARQFCSTRSMKRIGVRVSESVRPRPRLACLFRHTQHAQEEAAEDRLHAEDHGRETPQGVAHGGRHIERAPPLAAPLDDEPDVESDAYGQKDQAGQNAAFEVQVIEQTHGEGVTRQKTAGPTVDLGVAAEPEHLIADDDPQGADQHRVNVEDKTREFTAPGCQPGHDRQAAAKQDARRNQVQPERAHEEQEAEVPPAVAEAAQVRRPIAAVRMQHDRHFADPLPQERRLHDHLAGELHARRRELQAFIGIFAETPQPAMSVANRRVKEHVQDAGQHGVADIAMQPGHGAGLDAALEAVAHDQFVALPEAVDEGAQRAEAVVTGALPHYDELSAGGVDPTLKRGAIALAVHRHDAGAGGAGQFRRTVRRAVVGDDDLPGNAESLQTSFGLGHAAADRARLVQARHHDADFNVGLRGFDARGFDQSGHHRESRREMRAQTGEGDANCCRPLHNHRSRAWPGQMAESLQIHTVQIPRGTYMTLEDFMKSKLVKTALVGISAACLLAGAALAQYAASDLKKMAGTWKTVVQEAFGKPTPKDEIEKTAGRLIVKGDSYEVYFGKKSIDKGTIKLDASKTPREIDVKTQNDEIMKGIYKIEKDEMTVCFGQPGIDRPKEFKTKEGQILIGYKRVKE